MEQYINYIRLWQRFHGPGNTGTLQRIDKRITKDVGCLVALRIILLSDAQLL